MSDQHEADDPGGTGFNARYAKWQRRADETYEEFQARCPGSAGYGADPSSTSHASNSPEQMDFEEGGNTGSSTPSNFQDTASNSSFMDERQRPIKYPENVLNVVFHLYVYRDAEKATIEFEKPLSYQKNVTLNLKCVSDGGYGKYWKSHPITVHIDHDDSIRYRYIVRYHHGTVKRVTNFLKSIVVTVEPDVKEIGYKRTIYPGKNQYDVFKEPKNPYHNECIFAGQFHFVKMLYGSVKENGTNLKEAMIECEHVGFGHPSYTTSDRLSFFDWVKESAKHGINPLKSAYMCALLGQFLEKIGFTISLSAYLRPNSTETVDPLLFHLRSLSRRLLPSSSLKFIKSIDMNLLEASSNKHNLGYILNFCRLFDGATVVDGARNLGPVIKADDFDQISGKIVDVLSGFQDKKEQTIMLEIVVSESPNLESLWKLCRLLETKVGLTDLTESAVARFCKLFTRSLKPDLLQTPIWKDVPNALKPKLAIHFCDAVIEQVKTNRGSFDYGILKDLILDKDLQKWATTSVVTLLRIISRHRNKHLIDVACEVLNAQNFSLFWEKMDPNDRERVIEELVPNKMQLGLSGCYSYKERVVGAFQVLQELGEIRAIRQRTGLLEFIGKYICQETQRLGLRAIVDAYDDIQRSLRESAKQWYMTLLGLTVNQQQACGSDVKLKLIEVVRSACSLTTSLKSIEIDGGREELLLMLVAQAKIPKGKQQIDESSVHKVIRSVLSEKEMWALVFQVSGKTDRLHQHQHYKTVKQAMSWLSNAVMNGFISIDFLKSKKDEDDVAELLALTGCTLPIKGDPNAPLFREWQKELISLSKEREEIIAIFDYLKKAIELVGRLTQDKRSLNLKDFEHILSEYNDRKNKISRTTFADFRQENYWGPLKSLLGPAQLLYSFTTSILFVNFAEELIEEEATKKKQAIQEDELFVDEEEYLEDIQRNGNDDPHSNSMTVEDILLLLTSDGVTRFNAVFEKIVKMAVSSDEIDILFSGIKKEDLDQELEFVARLLGTDRPPYNVVRMLYDYARYEDIKERIEKALNCLQVLGYTTANGKSGDFLSKLESFLNCKKSGTLESISKQVVSMTIMKLDNRLEAELVDILSELSEATELTNFIIKTAKDNMVDLVDAVEEHSDQLIQEFTVSYLIDVHRFLSDLLSNKPDDPEKFLDLIYEAYRNLTKGDSGVPTKSEKSSRPKTKMAAKIKVCSNNVHSLRGLYMTLSNRGEMTKEIIKSAVHDGCYQVGMEENKSCEVLLTYARKGQTKSDTKYNMEDLNDLRSRALLIVNADKSNGDEIERETSVITSEELHQFIEQVDLITEITRKYEALRRSGIPDYQGSFWTKLQSTDEIKREEARVEKELTDWNSMLHLVRKQYFFLNYFHATQLWELRSFFQKPQSEKEISDKVFALFRCIDSRVTKEDLPYFQTKYKHPKKTDIQSELRAVGTALEEIFGSSQQKPLPIIASPKKTEAIVEPGKLYVGVLEPGSSQTVHVIMALFLNTCASLPKPSQLLFCHSQTTWEEIELFLFRTFEAHDHGITCKLHCLANVESLPNDIQFQLVDNLRRLTEEVTSPYLLAVICRGGSHHHIADQFGERTHYFGGMPDSELKKRFQQECPNTFFVTSDLPGLGKSEEICSHAAGRGKSLLTFPISGPFSRKYLVGRLCGLQVKKFHALHFDIGEVDDPNGLDTFLFELIVTGMVSSEAQLFNLPTNHIYIEIANTLQQRMRDSLPICKCFQKLAVEWKECSNLISSKELTSPLQVVCQYLKAYDSGTLESQEIVLSGPNKVQQLDSSTCRKLLSKHFFSGEDLSFNILENFISVLADQLMKFTRSPYFKPKHLVDMVGKSHDVRVRLFTALLEVATSFAARSVSTCKATQSEALSEEQAREALKKMQTGAGTSAAEMVGRVEEMIQWADNEHLVIMLHGAGAVTAIYRDLNKVPQGVKDLFKSQSMKGKGKGLEDYKTMSQEELQTRLERISDAPEKPNKEELESLSYALTPDNILKMALIIQRMQANIPVIIMGETGCGKTSLVQYLAKTCKTPFCVFNFHAGITEKEIIDFISSKDDESRKLQKESKSLWVFLDEINTCDYLGTINEIVCHRSLHGKPLSPNLVFVAACNPYRLRPPGQIMTAGLGGKTTLDEYSKLVYRVHPLPETMIDYVWDYGSLSEDDEKAYINRMVEGLFGVKYRKLLVELLAASQDFVRRADESSFCVSLRDVHRTTILIKWFYKMLPNRPPVHRSNISSRITKLFSTALKFDDKDRAIVLSLAHCYLSRLPSTDLRQEYCKKMSKIFQKNGRYSFSHPSDGFEQIIRAEQEDWLLRMELPPGTARNAALRENVFVILVCILNRMPVFVVGKPGCSKSLSMQVIRSNLRGRDSKDPFLKTLPQLFVVSFQGSESSTSEGIEKVFEKARKYKNKAENVLPVVLLDEIGLAEVSKFNPLKVLHRLLEPGKGQFPDVAVVGISNWALDAAKMNRAVHLSRPEPDEEDLYETGLSIREAQMDKPGDRPSLRSDETRYKNQLKCLAEAYHKYQSAQKHENFHGLRDYYSMVKCVEISSNKPDQNNENIQKAMQRNFGGLTRGKVEFQTLFLKRLENYQTTEEVLEFPVTDLIRDNLYDKLARHLMIITNGDSAIGILDQTLADLNKEKITIFGSQFEEDLSADYNHRVLSRIILCMEQNCVLILRDLEGIYGSLYDMLNQNYIVVGGKKNCRIALGAFSNPMCQVDDGFRCIVLVDENKVDYSDPPFLNRFEKQLLRFSDVLDAKQKEIIEELHEWAKEISTVTGHEKEFSEVDMFAGFHEDTLPSLVLFHSQNEQEIDKRDVIAQCKDDLMFVATPDAVIRARKSHLYYRNDEEVNELYNEYFEKPIHHGLKTFLQHSLATQDKDSKSMKLLVMTHSSIHTDVSKCVEGVSDVQTEKLSFFKSEKELSKRIQHFWRESKANLLAVQCRPDSDAPHMLLVKSIIEQQQKEYIDSSQGSEFQKHVCIVIHLQREARSEEEQRRYRWEFNFLSGWRQVMIDVLERPVIQIKEILESPIVNILDSDTMPFNKVAEDQLLWCFTRIKYPPSKQPEPKDTIDLVESITSSPRIMECFKTLCCQWIADEESGPKLGTNTDTWQVSVACDRKTLINCSTLVKAMQYFVTHLVRRPLARIVYFLQKESAWKVLRESKTQLECEKLLQMNSVFNIRHVPDPQDAESLVVDVCHLELQYPFSYSFFKRVDGLYEFFSEEYRRKCIEEEDTLDENGELSEASKKSLIVRVSRKVQQVITEMLDSDYLVNHISEYVDDALDIKSEEFSLHLTRAERISILKALFVDQLSDVTSIQINDVPCIVTQLHSLFWTEGDTITPLLDFVQACIPEVPFSIDELIQKFNEKKEAATKKEDVTHRRDEIAADVLEASKQVETDEGHGEEHLSDDIEYDKDEPTKPMKEPEASKQVETDEGHGDEHLSDDIEYDKDEPTKRMKEPETSKQVETDEGHGEEHLSDDIEYDKDEPTKPMKEPEASKQVETDEGHGDEHLSDDIEYDKDEPTKRMKEPETSKQVETDEGHGDEHLSDAIEYDKEEPSKHMKEPEASKHVETDEGHGEEHLSDDTQYDKGEPPKLRKEPEEHDEKEQLSNIEDDNMNLIDESLEKEGEHPQGKQGGREIVESSPRMEDFDFDEIDTEMYQTATDVGLEDFTGTTASNSDVPSSDFPEERTPEDSDKEEEVETLEDDGEEDDYEKEDETDVEEEDGTTFGEFLVQEICASMLPTDDLVHSYGGIVAWQSKTTFVLSTATKFYTQVPAFHYLKVCYDLSTLIDLKANTYSLYALGELASSVEEENYLDSTRIFESIYECIEDLREEEADEEKLDEFLFVFYGRCIESNPDTPLMGEILKQISSTRDERLLQLAVPILYRIFRTEEAAFSSEHFGRLLDSPEDLEDFPNLIEVNEALSELQASDIEELDCHFNVICCDLINKMAFGDLNLKKVSSSNDPVLHNFHKAAEILSSFDEDSKCSAMLGFVCAVSYLRAFIFHLAKFLIEHGSTLSTGGHDWLLRDIFGDLEEETLSSRKGSLNLLLIKELRQGLCLHDITQLINRCEKLRPLKKFAVVCSQTTPPKKLAYDPFQTYADESEAGIALGKHVAGSDSKHLDDVLHNVKTPRKKMELAAVVFEQFYAVRSIRTMKDTEDQAAQYVLEKLAPVPEPYQRFLSKIANLESFKCTQLEVSPESKALDVEVAVLIQHLSAILTSRYSGKSKKPIVSCLVDPTLMSNSFVLAAPADSSGYEPYRYFETVQRQDVFFFLCSTCGTRFTTSEEESALKCPNCNGSCEMEETKDNKFSLKVEKGYLHCEPESMHEEMLCARNLNPVEFRILHLIIYAALLAGYSLDLTSKTLAEFMKVENPSEVCFQYIQIDLNVLSAIMCCTQEKIIALLHQVLEEATSLLTEDSSLPVPHNEENRLSWESYFSQLVRPLVQKFRQNQLKPTNKKPKVENLDETKSLEKDLESQIEEFKEPQFPDIKSRNACLPRLFRIKHENSFEKLREFYLNSSDEVKESHQLLGLFLDYHKTLSRVGNLVALNAWSRRADVLLSRSLTRAEAKIRKIGDAVIGKELQRKQIGADSTGADSIRHAFEEFSKAWEDVVPLYNGSLGDNKHISEMSPVGLCLVERQDLGQYLCATVVGLANLQNEFLDKCLAIAASGKCPALQFLCKSGSTCSFPSVHVQGAKEKEIIRYEWANEFLDHSQHNLEYGHGTEIIYDLAKIEKDLAGSFLLGKAYLTTSKGMREFVFSKQLFHDCANILNDLNQAIPQEKLASNIETELSGTAGKSLDDIQVLLEHMEIVLCFLKRTGGKPEESLLDYVGIWITASRPFPKDLLPKSQNAIQLRHVCALYEFLEDKLAVKAVGCVGDEYRKAFPDDIKQEMDGNEVSQDEGSTQRILGATVTAVKRFIFRYLNMKPAANSCLSEFMEDRSLWPMSLTAKHDQNDFKITEIVPTLFPKMLTIAHAFGVHNYYQGRLDELNPKKKRLNAGGIATRSRPMVTRPKDKKRKPQAVGKGFT